MMLFSETDQQNLMNEASRSPAAGPSASFGERFGAAFDVATHVNNFFAQDASEHDFVQQKLDDYQQRTGERLHNPVDFPAYPIVDGAPTRASETQAVRDAFAAKAKSLNDPSLTFPSDNEITEGGLDIARQTLTRQEQLAQGAQQGGAGIGSFVGGLAGGAADPSNAVAMAAIPEGGLAAKMLGAAAGFGGTEFANNVANYGFKKSLNPDFGPSEIADDVVKSAVGGAGFELGGAALKWTGGALWRRLKGIAPAVADKIPQGLQDSGNVAERQEDIAANNPFPPSAEGEAAHHEAMAKIEDDMRAERPPELPPSAEQVSHVPPPSEPAPFADTIARAAAHPDQDIGQIGAALENAAPELEALRSAIEKGDVAPGADITRPLADAAKAIMDARDARIPLEDHLATGPDFHSDAAQLATRLFLKDDGETMLSQADMTANLRELGADLRQAPAEVAQPASAGLGERERLEGRIRSAMADEKEFTARVFVRLDDLRNRLADIDRPTMDAALIRMTSDRQITLTRSDNPRDINQSLRDAAIVRGGNPVHYAFLRRAPDEASGLVSSVEGRAAIKAVTSPEAIDKAFADPKTMDAAAADLRRSIDQGRNNVPVADGEGGVKLGKADVELKTIEDQEAMAAEIQACAAPVREVEE